MSLVDIPRHPCVHCQGEAFRASFEHDDVLGDVKFMECLNCGYTFPEYSPAQIDAMRRMDEQEEAARTQALNAIWDEYEDRRDPTRKRPYRLYMSGPECSGMVEHGLFATVEEAEAEASRLVTDGFMPSGSRATVFYRGIGNGDIIRQWEVTA